MDKIFVINGCSNHSNKDREINDYYATEPSAVEKLLEVEAFNERIWECAVGGGHIANVLTAHGYKVKASDIIDRGYPNTKIIDFLEYNGKVKADIITNPPYKYAQQFVEKTMEILEDGCKCAMLLKVTFLESKRRKNMFEKYPPKVVYVFSERTNPALNGEFDKYNSGAVAYAWYVWEKGFTGNPIIKWL